MTCMTALLMGLVLTADGGQRVYFGTYTRGASEGIYVADLDADGKLTSLRLAAEVENPSFLALHPTRPLLFSVGEMGSFEGKPGGAVSAFSIDPATGKLTLLNQQSSQGGAPCHLVVDATGRYVLAANYSGGNVICLPIDDDGRLGPATSLIQHEGSSVHPQRQQRPHAHSINLDAANRFAFAADLGLDKILIYRFYSEKGRLTPHDPPAVAMAPGAGPRHFAFHPSGRFAYAINELNSTVTAMRYDAQRGSLEVIHSVTTLPSDFDGQNSTAEVRVHPSGKFLYGSNRGHNSIAVFRIDPESGRIEAIGHTSTRGETPRNFNIDPSGRFLLAANQATDNVVVFQIDAERGTLEPTGHDVEIGAPVCVLFAR